MDDSSEAFRATAFLYYSSVLYGIFKECGRQGLNRIVPLINMLPKDNFKRFLYHQHACSLYFSPHFSCGIGKYKLFDNRELP